MLFKNIAIIDDNFEIKENMYVEVKGSFIEYIGETEPLGAKDIDSYDGSGKLLMPGFYNAHSHVPMSLLRGYGENMQLSDWLNKRIFPFEDKLTGDDIYNGTMLGMAEMIRFGIISTTDMYYHGDEMARAVIESGAKMNLSIGTVCFNDSSFKELSQYSETKRLNEQFKNNYENRLIMDLSIHGEYTSTPKVVEGLADYARESGLRVQVHVSESVEEHEACKERREGKTPTQYLNELGLFDSPATAAHCVNLEGEDFDILAEKGVTVANCVKSNLKLSSGFCDVPMLMKKGVNIAIGTDSVASNNNLNFLEEIKFFALVHKGHSFDPTVITPKEAVACATLNGAKSQGRNDCGSIKVGNRADLIVMDISSPYMKPTHNLLNNLVYSGVGTDVCLTMSDGKVLYKDGEYKTIDIEKVIYNCEKIKNRILSELKG